jgi:hypothetical protein
MYLMHKFCTEIEKPRDLVPQAVVCLETKVSHPRGSYLIRVIVVIIFWRSEDILKRSPQDQGISTLQSLSSTSKLLTAKVS